jgi:hypothetical protein
MCSVGHDRRSIDSEPMATWTNWPSRTTEKQERAAETAARVVGVLLADDEDVVRALVISSFSRSIPANALNSRAGRRATAEQWQFAA